MGKIRIINMRKAYSIRPSEMLYIVDRNSIFGNPYKITKKNSREKVIRAYREYFTESLKYNAKFREAFDSLVDCAKQNDVVLACWCAPLPCHAEIIKAEIEKQLLINKW